MTPRIAVVLLVATGALVACRPAPERRNVQQLTLANDNPDSWVAPNQDRRSDAGRLKKAVHVMDLDEEANHDSLPPLPFGMTMDMIRDGDALYHGKGRCLDCHGAEGEGLPARGKTLTTNIHFVPEGDWKALDSLILVGIDDAVTRTHVAMPPRGKNGDLTAYETKEIAAYIWAISQVKGEPWEGGHAMHAPHDWRASAMSAIP